MSGSKPSFLLPAIGVVALVAGGVGAYVYFNQGGSLTPQSSAKLVPNNALMTTFISTDDRAWDKLQKFGTPEARQQVEKGVQEFRTKMLADTNFDVDKDLKPWVGNVMVAVMPPGEAGKTRNSNVLFVVGIKDKSKAFNFSSKIKEQKGAATKEVDYKGVKITEITEQPKNNSYHLAVLNNTLVLSADRTVVQQAIDTSKGEPSFATRAGVDKLLSKGTGVQNPLAEVYIPDYATAYPQLVRTDASPVPYLGDLAQPKQIQSLVAGVGVDDMGVRLKMTTELNPTALKVDYKPVSGDVVSQFPSDTLAVAGGQGLKSLWSAMTAQTSDPSVQNLVKATRTQISESLKLDADKEVFGWMDGEFALGIIPAKEGILSQFGVGPALVIRTSDRPTAEATLAKLDALAKSNNLIVGERQVQGKSVTEWTVPVQGAFLGHGWLDQQSLFIAMGPLVDVIAAKPQAALNSGDTFKSATASLPKSSSSYFYLDMEKTLALLTEKGFFKAQGSNSAGGDAVLQSIRGIGLTAVQLDSSTNQLEVLAALKPSSTTK